MADRFYAPQFGRPVIVDRETGATVDQRLTRRAAEVFARELNEGRAVVNPRATVGCRVMPV